MDEHTERRRPEHQSTDEGSGTLGGTETIAVDTVVSALADERRRTILNALVSAPEETLAYDALVDHVADRLREDGAGRVTDGQRRAVRGTLHHIHLPQLADAELVEHETETEQVTFVGDEPERELLRTVDRLTTPNTE
jgi:DNA-binding transcriptional ArsR family regulator